MSLEDDERILRRKRLLVETGKETAALLSEKILRDFGIEGAFSFNSGSHSLDSVLRNYFSGVAQFKGEHDFDAGDRINYSKISGLMTLTLLNSDTSTLFKVAEEVRGSAFHQFVVPFFIYRLIGAILMIDLERVDPTVESDLVRCLTLHPNIRADAEWLFWSMRVLQVAYGNGT